MCAGASLSSGDDTSTSVSSPDGSRCSGSLLTAPNPHHRHSAVPYVFKLSPEEFICIFEYLNAAELCVSSSVCHPLRSLVVATDTILWRKLCLDLWRNKQGFRKFCDHFTLLSSVHSADPHRNLIFCGSQTDQRRKVQMPRSTPKGFTPVALSPVTTLQCIRASILPENVKSAPPAPLRLPPPSQPSERKLWWELTPSEQVRRIRRILACRSSQSSCTSDEAATTNDDEDTTDEPDEALTWKFAYFMSLRDSKRTLLTMHDLIEGTWTIQFRQIPDRVFPLRFQTNGKLVTPLHPDGLCFQLSQQGAELNVHVFPVLAVCRVQDDVLCSSRADIAANRSSWGWEMKNYFVTIHSEDVPLPLYIQRLQRLSSLRPP